MATSEMSSKGNTPRGESFSSGYSDRNDDVGGSNTISAASGGAKVDAETALYTELWRACVGPLVSVPRERELVYYFPQGHIEQVEASTNQVAEQQMQLYNLPSKIMCHVANVRLKAEPDTDEVFAQVTLMPEPNQNESAVKKDHVPSPPPRFHVHSFCKTLTASDTSTHGGFSVLRRHADECLPPLRPTIQLSTDQFLKALDICHQYKDGISIATPSWKSPAAPGGRVFHRGSLKGLNFENTSFESKKLSQLNPK